MIPYLVTTAEEQRKKFLSLKTPREIADLLEVDYGRLVYHLYKVPDDEKYVEFSIPKRAGGARQILAPATALKILQRKLAQVLNEVYTIKPSAYGFLLSTGEWGSMGRIDVVLPDPLENQLRVEIAKRYGGKKGDLGRAVEAAIRLWIGKPVVERLKRVAQNPALNSADRRMAIEALAEMGEAAVEPLLEIANAPQFSSQERHLALEKVKRLLAESKRRLEGDER